MQASVSGSSDATVQKADSALQSAASVPSGWKKVSLKNITFFAPPTLQPKEVEGTDSVVWKFVDRNMELVIDVGLYSEKPHIYEQMPEYREEQVRVGGRSATICFFRYDDSKLSHQYASAIFFSDIDSNGTKLSFFIRSLSPVQEEAKKIFHSIKFQQ